MMTRYFSLIFLYFAVFRYRSFYEFPQEFSITNLNEHFEYFHSFSEILDDISYLTDFHNNSSF